MIDAKDVVRKVASGCSHIIPVKVTCSDCTTSIMTMWEVGMRENIKRQEMVSLREEHDRMNKTVTDAKQGIDMANQEIGRLVNFISRLESENSAMKKRLEIVQRENGDMNLRMKTEETSRYLRTIAAKKVSTQ